MINLITIHIKACSTPWKMNFQHIFRGRVWVKTQFQVKCHRSLIEKYWCLIKKVYTIDACNVPNISTAVLTHTFIKRGGIMKISPPCFTKKVKIVIFRTNFFPYATCYQLFRNTLTLWCLAVTRVYIFQMALNYPFHVENRFTKSGYK